MPPKYTVKREKPLLLFGMAHAGFIRNFEETIQRLLLLGVDVHVHLFKKHEKISIDDYSLPSTVGAGTLSFSIGKGNLTNESSKNKKMVESLRVKRNIIYYLRPHLQGSECLQKRFDVLQKKNVMTLDQIKYWRQIFCIFPNFILDVFDRLLAWRDEQRQVSPFIEDLIYSLSPSLVAVTPAVAFGSEELELLKGAKKRKIPTVLTVASWDNLSNKGRILIRPDYVSVWNQAMAKEAMHFHKISEKSIWITGAPVFDRWFDMRPSLSRKDFLKSLGLEHQSKVVLYVCSSLSIAGKKEIDLISYWLHRMRKHTTPQCKLLSSVNVIIRPHPMALDQWSSNKDINLRADLKSTRVWPTDCKHPTSRNGAETFFNSLFFADAVVGLNTSVMIEAAILRKPVLTFEKHTSSNSQQDNLHYRHLADSGFLHRAADLKEHFAQLIEVLENPQHSAEQADLFIESFVRPLGRDQSASQLLSEKLISILV